MNLPFQCRAYRVAHQMAQFAHRLESLSDYVTASVGVVALDTAEGQPYDRLNEAMLRNYLPSREERL